MKLIKLSEDAFTNYAITSPQITFHQTKEWAKLKEQNGWFAYYVGLIDGKEKIQAAALLLAKPVPVIHKKIFYSPRGFLLDYQNQELLMIFTQEIKKFVKDRHGIFVKIDPYVMYQQRDINGAIVPEGINHKEVVSNLIKATYRHFGFNVMQDTLQPRWMHTITVKDKTLADLMRDMDPKTRQILRKNERLGVKTREICREEIPIFKDIMQHTGERREFIDRPLAYYEAMWDALHDSGILKIMIAEIDFVEELSHMQQQIQQLQQEIKVRSEKFRDKTVPMNEKKFHQKQQMDEKEIARLEEEIKKIKQLQKKFGNKPILGGILFLIYGQEVVSLYGGSKKDLMRFQSAYTVHWAGIKYALENGYDTYNFYGITGDFSADNPLLGLYLFKKSFGGQVVELVGEFDLVVNPIWYHIYNLSYSCYHKLKNLKKH